MSKWPTTAGWWKKTEVQHKNNTFLRQMLSFHWWILHGGKSTIITLSPHRIWSRGWSLGCFEGASFGSFSPLQVLPRSTKKWNLVDGTCIDCGWLLLMEEIRRSRVEVGSSSHDLQGFKNIPGGAGFLPSTVCPALVCKVAIFEPRTKNGALLSMKYWLFCHDGILIISL